MLPIEPSLMPTGDFLASDADGQAGQASTVVGETLPTPSVAAAPSSGFPTIPGYRVTGELARGGMGRVLAAQEERLDREVAVKILLPGADASRFITEAKITAQLPHPSIPPVHALGTLADGSPFLVMKLVRGSTLAQLLASRKCERPEFHRFIQSFEQIAQAVGFAHSQGILHRDLKPSNVMVGAFGEVQVMDWGLAKSSVSRDATRSAPAETPAAAPTDATQAGTIMGTPSYMAPEQARGEAVDARADVFALGGILCTILTGQAVYQGASTLELITHAASAATAEAFTRLETCGADAELIDLCKRCLAAEPATRPADGGAVATLVATYRTGVEQRLQAVERERAAATVKAGEQRKRRRLWVGSAAALALAIIGGLVAVLAVQRRAADELGRKNDDLEKANAKTVAALGRAEAREQVAVDAVEGYRKAVEDHPALRDDPQFADLRRTLLEAPAAFCTRLRDDLRADSAVDAKSVARLAGVLYQLGRLRGSIGRRADSLAALTEADDLLTRAGDNPANWRQRAEVLLRKGIEQDNQADSAAALVTIERAEAVLAARLRDQPNDAVALDLLAKARFSRAWALHRTKRQAESLAVCETAAEIAAQAARQAPHDAEVHYTGLAIANFRVSELAEQQRADEALKAAEVAWAALERYRQVEKDLESVLKCEADLLTTRGKLLDDIGNKSELGGVLKRVLEIRRGLLAKRLSSTQYRNHLADAVVQYGRYLSRTGSPAEALLLVREGRQLCESLYQDDSSESSYTLFQNLVGSWTTEGYIHHAAGRLEDAITAFRAVSRLYERRPAAAASPISLSNYAGNEYNLGTLLTDAGRPDEAMAAFQRALDVRRQLVKDHPDRPENRLYVAFTLGNMARCLNGRNLPAAEAYLREAVEILADLAPKYPKSAAIRDGLPRNRNSLATVLRDRGNLDGAITLLQENLRADPSYKKSQRLLADVTRMRELLPRLPAIVSGSAQPANPSEGADFASLCMAPFQRRFTTAVRLYAEAFTAKPDLADDLENHHRYTAACCALQAARGEGVDAPADAATRAALRAQALGWLRADLALRQKQAAATEGPERKAAADDLLLWLKEPVFHGLRPGVGRIGMPDAERREWDRFWADVKATLAIAQKPPEAAPRQ